MTPKTRLVKAKVLKSEVVDVRLDSNKRTLKAAILEISADQDDEYQIHKHIPSPFIVEEFSDGVQVVDRLDIKPKRRIMGMIRKVTYPHGKTISELVEGDIIELEVEVQDFESN